MKRSRVVALTLAGISLSLTGCRRSTYSASSDVHGTSILPPSGLNPDMRSCLPTFVPGQDVSGQSPPLNAYDPQLGYYHLPCTAWFPYPYDHYDSRWGYYRCGRWSKNRSTVHHSSGYYGGLGRPFTGTNSMTSSHADGDLAQPPGAPLHSGVPHSQASSTRLGSTSRGGFGSTGRSSSSFFSSGS
ncbi:MAG: hypothetical protein ABL974_11430 [Prosthecobacter sp.]